MKLAEQEWSYKEKWDCIALRVLLYVDISVLNLINGVWGKVYFKNQQDYLLSH